MKKSWLALTSFIWLVFLSACSNAVPQPTPTVSAPSPEAVVPLPTLLADPQRWSGATLTVIAPARAADEQVLTPQSTDAGASAPMQALWLSDPLPDSAKAQLSDQTGVIKAHGTLSPPGAYGRGQQFSYQFTADQIGVLQPERTTLINLADNPRALDRILLTVSGTILAQDNSALLVDQVTERGVPTQSARQIKLPRTSLGASVLDQLNQAGDVRWGAVEITGWWQDGALTPLLIEPQAQPEDTTTSPITSPSP